jgi:hypothetical protein
MIRVAKLVDPSATFVSWFFVVFLVITVPAPKVDSRTPVRQVLRICLAGRATQTSGPAGLSESSGDSQLARDNPPGKYSVPPNVAPKGY